MNAPRIRATATPTALPTALPTAVLIALLGAVPAMGARAADVATVEAPTVEALDARTGLPRWDVETPDTRLRLVQRLPDQTRAFFIGRGFSSAQADRIARHCVLQTILYNDGGQPMRLNIADWSARVGEREIRPRSMDDWQAEWEAAGVAAGPRIAFRWALFPNAQEFAPGDWNMGMTTWPVPAGTTLDVHVRWQVGETVHELVAEGVRCAASTPQP